VVVQSLAIAWPQPCRSMCGCIGNCILARAPIRPNSAWKALGVIGPSRSVIKTCEDGPCSRCRLLKARISSPCIGWTLGEPFFALRTCSGVIPVIRLQGLIGAFTDAWAERCPDEKTRAADMIVARMECGPDRWRRRALPTSLTRPYLAGMQPECSSPCALNQCQRTCLPETS